MQVSSTTGAAAATSGAAAATSDQVLGKDDFLRLLMTQIQYQDPMQPMDDTQFIAQLAQFSSLEQMQQMNSALATTGQASAATQALALIGKQITAQAPGSSNTITGQVDAVSFSGSTPVLVVGGNEVQLSWVTQVR